jgi:hypothetical protein
VSAEKISPANSKPEEQKKRMSKSNYYLSAAVIANQYVKSKMTIGASNKPRLDFWRASKCAGSMINKGEMREYVDQQIKAAVDADTSTATDFENIVKFQRLYLEKSAVGGELYGCGNCGEQSAIAFMFLKKQNTFPLDWMHVNDYEHAFVIIGRQRGSSASNPLTWGEVAVICDPWRDVVATVKSQANYFSTRTPVWMYGEIG